MKHTADLESWCRGILLKRSPDAIRVLVDLLEAGLKHGECSPNDMRDICFDEPNVIGSVFKILPRFGFVQSDRRVATQLVRKHKRKVFIWELRDPQRAQVALAVFRGFLVSKESSGQLVLL